LANGAVALVNPNLSVTAQNGGRLYVHGTFDERVFLNVNGAASAIWGPLSATDTNSSIDVQFADIGHAQVNATTGADGLIQDSELHDFDNPSGGTLGRPIMMCNFANSFAARRNHYWNYYENLVRNGVIHIEECLFERMTGDALDFDSAQPGSYTRRCTYRHGDVGNVDAVDIGPSGDLPGSTDTVIDNSIMWDFPFDKGVSVGDNNSSHGIIVSNCLIYGCLSGVMAKDLCDVSVRNCTIVNNTSGFTNYNKSNPGSSTGGGITTNSYNNILWENITAIGMANNGMLFADHNDFGNTNWPGDGNISLDPLFVNAAARNYRLQAASPCRGTGRDGADMGVTYPLGGIPAQPLRLAVLSSGTNALTLTWSDDSQNEDGVIVQRSSDAMTWATIATLPAEATNHVDDMATLGQKYYYRVQHTNYVGISPFSNIGSGQRLAPAVNVGGSISADTTWFAASHYVVTSAVTIASGATLTIQAGATICFNPGISMTIANGGRLLAEGAANAPILFTRNGTSGSWGHIIINGAVGSPETRIAYAHFEFNGGSPCLQVVAGTVFFDHLTFGNTAVSYVHVDDASFIIQDCIFPSATAQFELVHGTGGIKSDGHGIFLRNFFGVPIAYNDVVDFTGGNRPGPIIHFINNVFTGATDDELDLDGTDAWVEGNIFLHAHKNGSPDTASGVSGGDDGGATSEITVIGNLFYDCDQAAMGKGGNFYTLINNTIVHQTHQGGTDTDGAVVALADTGFSSATGMYLEANIIYDAEALLRFYTNSFVTVTNNLMPFEWSGPGANNSTNDPMLVHIPQLSETAFTNWAQAQIMRTWFGLQPGSPAIGTGPNGRDKGGAIPLGASISGEPPSITTESNATLVVGIVRSDNGIPVAGWPNGSGFTHYKWRLDGDAWSVERPIATPITLTGLASGPHYVEVSGKLDSGLYQDDPLFGPVAAVTRSRSWTVDGVVRIEGISITGSNSVQLQFTALANHGYTIEYRDSLSTGSWQVLAHLDPPPSTRTITITDNPPPATPMRFYRLVAY
jgi:hypothetical protein